MDDNERWHSLEALAQESPPPPEVEERIVEALREKGLLRKRSPLRPARWLAVAAVAAALFAGGVLVGQWPAPAAMPPATGPDFILLLHGGTEDLETLTAEESQRRYGEYAAWARSTGEKGFLAGGEELHDDRRWLGTTAAQSPGLDSKLNVQGYFLINASSYEQAVSIASGCPHLQYGGSIEVRQIQRREGS